MNKTEEFIKQNELRKAKEQEEKAQAAAKKKKGGFKRFLCFLLIVALIIGVYRVGFVNPGFFLKKEEKKFDDGIVGKTTEKTDDKKNDNEGFFEDSFADSSEIWQSGLSDIAISKSDLSIEPVCANVSGTNNRVELSNGVSVDFGEFNLGEEEMTLEVREVGVKSDDSYEALVYDFSLEDMRQFASNVEITVPYDTSWGEDVFLQYFNEDTGEWELKWSDVDGNGNLTFTTNHFSTYAVFRSKINALIKSESGIFGVYDDPEGNPYKQYVTINHKLLRQEVDNGTAKTIEDLEKRSKNDFLTSALEGIGVSSDVAESTDILVSLAGDSSVVKSVSDALGAFGDIMSVTKVMIKLYQTEDFVKTFKDCKSELESLALGAIGTAAGGPVSAVCSTISVGIFIYDKFEAFNYNDTKSAAEYAYREFSDNYITYKMNTDILKGVCGYNYRDDKNYEDVKNSTMQYDEMRLKSSATSEYADWYEPLNYISNHYDFKAVPTAIESLIRQYTSVFFNKFVKDKKAFEKFLEETPYGVLGFSSLKDNYEEPSEADRKEYVERYQKELYKRLKPYIENVVKDSKTKLLDGVVQSSTELEKQLNKTITFTLEGTEQYEGCSFVLEEPKNHKETGIVFSEKTGYKAECTVYSFVMAEWPTRIAVKDRDGNVLFAKDFTVDRENTVIYLGLEDDKPLGGDDTGLVVGTPCVYNYSSSGSFKSPDSSVNYYLTEAFKDTIVTVSKDGTYSVTGSASGDGWDVTATISSLKPATEVLTENAVSLTATINYHTSETWSDVEKGSFSVGGQKYTCYSSGSYSSNMMVKVTGTGSAQATVSRSSKLLYLEIEFPALYGNGKNEINSTETLSYPYDPTHPDEKTSENKSTEIENEYLSFSIDFLEEEF